MDELLKSLPKLNYPILQDISDQFEVPVRNLLLRVRELGLEYEPTVYVERPKVRKESKADLVKQIENILGTSFKGLDKLVLDDLVTLRNAVQK